MVRLLTFYFPAWLDVYMYQTGPVITWFAFYSRLTFSSSISSTSVTCVHLARHSSALYLPVWNPVHMAQSLFSSHFPGHVYNDRSTLFTMSEAILKRIRTKTQKLVFSVCLLHIGVQCVFVLFWVYSVYWPICHGALKLDMSILTTTYFLWTSLQFISSF